MSGAKLVTHRAPLYLTFQENKQRWSLFGTLGQFLFVSSAIFAAYQYQDVIVQTITNDIVSNIQIITQPLQNSVLLGKKNEFTIMFKINIPHISASKESSLQL